VDLTSSYERVILATVVVAAALAGCGASQSQSAAPTTGSPTTEFLTLPPVVPSSLSPTTAPPVISLTATQAAALAVRACKLSDTNGPLDGLVSQATLSEAAGDADQAAAADARFASTARAFEQLVAAHNGLGSDLYSAERYLTEVCQTLYGEFNDDGSPLNLGQ
jgi:hypothetical protein